MYVGMYVFMCVYVCMYACMHNVCMQEGRGKFVSSVKA